MAEDISPWNKTSHKSLQPAFEQQEGTDIIYSNILYTAMLSELQVTLADYLKGDTDTSLVVFPLLPCRFTRFASKIEKKRLVWINKKVLFV